jgi:hypothetical protein
VAKTEEKVPTPKPDKSAPSTGESAQAGQPKAAPVSQLAALRAKAVTLRAKAAVLRGKAPRAFNAVEGASFALMGEIIATAFIKGKPLIPERLLFFALWGAPLPSIYTQSHLPWAGAPAAYAPLALASARVCARARGSV